MRTQVLPSSLKGFHYQTIPWKSLLLNCSWCSFDSRMECTSWQSQHYFHLIPFSRYLNYRNWKHFICGLYLSLFIRMTFITIYLSCECLILFKSYTVIYSLMKQHGPPSVSVLAKSVCFTNLFAKNKSRLIHFEMRYVDSYHISNVDSEFSRFNYFTLSQVFWIVVPQQLIYHLLWP